MARDRKTYIDEQMDRARFLAPYCLKLVAGKLCGLATARQRYLFNINDRPLTTVGNVGLARGPVS